MIFKPKTAFEMRISAWRSDVCSSDLLLLLHLVGCAFLLGWHEHGAGCALCRKRVGGARRRRAAGDLVGGESPALVRAGPGAGRAQPHQPLAEIGRAHV